MVLPVDLGHLVSLVWVCPDHQAFTGFVAIDVLGFDGPAACENKFACTHKLKVSRR